MTSDEFRHWLTERAEAPRTAGAPDPGRSSPPTGRPLLMGVLNVTPDSFSDGGRFAAPGAAVAHAREMAAAGAELIDVGGESTRPGSQPVPAEEQARRVVPVIGELARLAARGEFAAVLSIDTTRAAVAEAALDAGAHLVNDISGGRDDPAMLPMVARRRVPVVLMHMRGTPATMQIDPRYDDVVGEVARFLRERLSAAVEAGVAETDVLLDPGIGFGKTAAHNLELLRRLPEIAAAAAGRPLVVGVSRKGFIGRISGESDPANRVLGTAAAVAWSAAHGASILRVHDVAAMAQVVRVIGAIQTGGEDRR
jgi:dihydropteroate synthase